jgi:hypothetical protein
LWARRKLYSALDSHESIEVAAKADTVGAVPAKGAVVVTSSRVLMSGGPGGIAAKILLAVNREDVVRVSRKRGPWGSELRLGLADGDEFTFRVYDDRLASRIAVVLDPAR